MSWACGGRCACTEGGRSLLERYGMAHHLGSPIRASCQSSAKKGRRHLEGGPALHRQQPPTLQAPISTIQAFLIAIFFSLFCDCAVFGSVTVSTPFLKFASILSASTPSGTPNDRWNEP